MIRRATTMGLLLGMALLGTGAAGVAQAQNFGGPPDAGDRWARYGDQDQGQGQGWDRDQSQNWDRDQGRGWYGDQGRGWYGGWFARTNLEGRWLEEGAYGRDGRDFGRDNGYGPRRMLPSFLQIDQSRRLVTIADFRGRTLQTIQIGGRQRWYEDSDILTGRWRGRALEVQRTTPRGNRMVQTFSVQDRGRTLVIHTWIDSGRFGQDLEFDRVYHRA